MTNFADITELGLTAEPETVEPEAYVPPYNESNDTAIDKAIYQGKLIDGKFKIGNGDDRTPVRFGKATSKKNNQTYLAVEYAVEVADATVGGKTIGTKFVYSRVDTIPERLKFDKVKTGRENASTFMDLLVACGWTGRLSSKDDYSNALVELVGNGASGRFSIDKGAYCNPKSNEYAGCGTSLRGEDSFTGVFIEAGVPNEGIGTRVACPGNHPIGAAPILTARNVIKRVYPIKK